MPSRIEDYALISDCQAAALVARDGSIDWLCLPDLDSASVFGALLDADHGGRFALAPEVPHEASRRYLPGTNVLETTFTTAAGAVRVTDAMTLPASGFAPYRELVRRVEGVAGCVPLAWQVEPRLQYGSSPARVSSRGGVATVADGRDALAVFSWDAGEATVSDGSVGARFEASEGTVGPSLSAPPTKNRSSTRAVPKSRRAFMRPQRPGATGAPVVSTTAPGATPSSAVPSS